MKFIDGHCDTITTAMAKKCTMDKNELQIDFERLGKTGCICQFFAVWLEKKLYKNAFENTKKAIIFFENEIKGSNVKKALNFNDIEMNIKNKAISAVLCVEGGEAVEGKTENLDKLYNMGVRLMTLCWNYENELGYGAATGVKRGLKKFGTEVVKRMNELNMIIDVSHLNEAGFWSVCENSEKPFAATHSNAFSVCGHCRNLTDSQIRAIAKGRGVIGLNMYPPFLNESGRADINDILKHTEHILNKGSEECLVLGCDFDGIDIFPENIYGAEKLPLLYESFVGCFGKELADKIFYKNYISFIRENIQ